MTGVQAVVAMIALACAPQAMAEQRTVYRFAVAPQQKVEILAKLWTPFLAELSRRSGVLLEFASAPDATTCESRFKAGEYDFVYANPIMYAKEGKDYSAFARENARPSGILVVPRESPRRSLKDLAGARLAFPNRRAYAATLLNLKDIETAGLNLESGVFITHLASHDAAYEAVTSGLADAAGGVQRTFDLLPPTMRARMRVLHRTRPGLPLAFVANRRTPKADVEKVAAALTSMASDEKGRALLKSLSMAGVIRAQDSYWDELRGPAQDSSGGFK